MALQFAPASPSDQPAVMKFLLDVFQSDPGMNSFRPEVWQWKYFSEHPEWSAHRSFVLKNELEVAAHGGVWPIRLAVGERELKAIHLIDWAGSRSSLGAGIHLLRSIAKMTDIMLTVGGTPDTRKILPKIGYKHGGVLKRYVRVVRPWQQLRTRPHHDWKAPLRFLRNSSSMINPLSAIPSSWQVSKVDRFDASIKPISESGGVSSPVCSIRNDRGLNHMLECPAAEFSGFTVAESGRLVAYFVIAKLGRQARIVDLRMHRENSEKSSINCRSLCSAAVRAASKDPQVCEIVVGLSASTIGKELEQIGFRLCREDEILYYDPRNLLPPGALLDLNLIDSDLSFLYNPKRPYIS